MKTMNLFCLNPFFIRARFQRPTRCALMTGWTVLIPSSSGQGFKVAIKQINQLALVS